MTEPKCPFKLYLQQRETTIPVPDDTGIAYVVGRNGTFLVKENPIFRATLPVSNLPMLQDVPDAGVVEYRLPPIPSHLTHQVARFFQGVFNRMGTEAILLIQFNPETETFSYLVPKQWATSGHCDYDSPETGDAPLLLVGSIHSHGSMGAFHSSTDIANEASWDGVHVTFGHVNDCHIGVVASLVVGTKRQSLDPTNVFEGLEPQTFFPERNTKEKKKRYSRAFSALTINGPMEWVNRWFGARYALGVLVDDEAGKPDPKWFGRVRKGVRQIEPPPPPAVEPEIPPGEITPPTTEET